MTEGTSNYDPDPMHIVIPDDYPPTYASPEQENLERLAQHGRVTLHTTRAAHRAELFDRLASAEVIINVRAYTALAGEAFSHAPALKMVSILGAGTDNVDLDAARRRGIIVTNTPAVGAPSVAELTLGLMLAVTRSIPISDVRLRQGTRQHVEPPDRLDLLGQRNLVRRGTGRVRSIGLVDRRDTGIATGSYDAA